MVKNISERLRMSFPESLCTILDNIEGEGKEKKVFFLRPLQIFVHSLCYFS